MKPLFQPQLVNDPFGDPALYIEFLFEHRALMFDLGDLRALASRKILRLSDVFVSHTHMDHFIGFDQIVRVCLGRQRRIRFYGPPGFIEHVGHRLGGYTWNLVQNYETDFTVSATELHPDGHAERALFRCRSGFEREDDAHIQSTGGVLLDEESFRVHAAVLDHRIPCLGFALEEKQHINVWKNRLDALGLPTGPWLRELKQAVRRDAPEETPFEVQWHDHDGEHVRSMTLGELKHGVLSLEEGQKIAYVVDAVYSPDNAARIIRLAHGADLFFLEAAFLDEHAHRAAATYHLTARQAGELAARAGVKRLVPFHFSARYEGEAAPLEREAQKAFAATQPVRA